MARMHLPGFLRGPSSATLRLASPLVAAALIAGGLIGAAFLLPDKLGVEALKHRSETMSKLARTSKEKKIAVTAEPYQNESFLADVEIDPGQQLDLARLLPASVYQTPGVMRHTGVRVLVRCGAPHCDLSIDWSQPSPAADLQILLYDPAERPAGYWSGAAGRSGSIQVREGAYRFVLNADEALNPSTKIELRLAGAVSTARSSEGLPRFELFLSEVALQNWEALRRKGAGAIDKYFAGGGEAFVGNDKVKGILRQGSESSSVRIGLVGKGNATHLSEDLPSFDIRVNSGPLVSGMSAFHLVSMRTENGLLDHVVNSILWDEGILVPRRLLVKLVFNGRDLGVYSMEERHRSTGLMEGIRRHDGQLVSRSLVYLNKSGDWPQKALLSEAEELSPNVVSRLDPEQTAKTAAFLSAFSSNHPYEKGDYRLYRSALVDSIEPWVKDLNPTNWPRVEEPLEFLTQASWWLAPPLHWVGSNVSPKLFPEQPGFQPNDDQFEIGPATLRVQHVHPSVRYLVATKEGRAAFERFLLYATDPAMQARFRARLLRAAAFVQGDLPYKLTEGSTRDDEEIFAWIKRQTTYFAARELPVPAAMPRLFAHSALLVAAEPGAQGVHLSFYNLSPFSARVRLDAPAAGLPSDRAITLAPSPWFLTLVPLCGLAGDLRGDQDIDRCPGEPRFPLSRVAAERLFALERLRHKVAGGALGAQPFADIDVSQEQAAAILARLGREDAVVLAGQNALASARIFRVDELPAGFTEATQDKPGAPIWSDKPAEGEAGPLHWTSATPVAGASVPFDLASSSFWTFKARVYLDPNKAGPLSVIFDTSHSGTKNCVLQQIEDDQPDPMLAWHCGGKRAASLGVRVKRGQWLTVVAAVDYHKQRVGMRIADVAPWQWIEGGELAADARRLWIGSMPSGVERRFSGHLASLDAWPRYIAEDPPSYASPDVVMLPAGQYVSGDRCRLLYLLSNRSARPIEVDLDALKWRHAPGAPAVAASVLGVWDPARANGAIDRLHSLRLEPPGAVQILPWRAAAPHFWAGAATPYFSGVTGKTSSVMLQVEIDCAAQQVFTDASSLVDEVSWADGKPPLVMVLDPFRIGLPDAPSALVPAASVKVARGGRGTLVSKDDESKRAIDNVSGSSWSPPAGAGVSWFEVTAGGQEGVKALAVLPAGNPGARSWSYTNARLLVQQGETWKFVRRLDASDADVERRGDWSIFPIPDAFRAKLHYRIEVDDPRFAGLAEIRPVMVTPPVPRPIDDAALAFATVGQTPDGMRILSPKTAAVSVDGPLVVPDDVELRLPAGTSLRFAPDAGILVRGRIKAYGTAEAPVSFQPATAGGKFVGLSLWRTRGLNELLHVHIARAAGGNFGPHHFSGGLSVYDSHARIVGSEFTDLQSNDGIHLVRSGVEIRDFVLDGSINDAIDSDWSYGTIENARMHNCGMTQSGDCIDLTGSYFSMRHVNIAGASDKGFSIGEASHAVIEDADVSGTAAGVAVKDGSYARIAGARFHGNTYGALRYIKKPFYQHTTLDMRDVVFSQNGQDMLRHDESRATREFDDIAGLRTPRPKAGRN